MKLRPRALVAIRPAHSSSPCSGPGSCSSRAPRTAAQSSGPAAERAGSWASRSRTSREGLRDTYDYEGAASLVSDVVLGQPGRRGGHRGGRHPARASTTTRSTTSDQATEYVRALRPGTLVDVTVWRDGNTRYLGRAEIADLDDRPRRDGDAARPARAARTRARRARPAGPRAPHVDARRPACSTLAHGGRGRLGVETHDLDADLARYFDAPDGKGVLVLRVVEDTPAAKAGLKAGDVILAVGGNAVADTEDLRRTLRDREAGDVELRILRSGSRRTVERRARGRRPESNLRDGDGDDWMGWMDDDDCEVDGDMAVRPRLPRSSRARRMLETRRRRRRTSATATPRATRSAPSFDKDMRGAARGHAGAARARCRTSTTTTTTTDRALAPGVARGTGPGRAAGPGPAARPLAFPLMPPAAQRLPPRFCPYCATPLVPADDHGVVRPTCPACGFIAYRNPAPAVGVILERKDGIVLVRRKLRADGRAVEPARGLHGVRRGARGDRGPRDARGNRTRDRARPACTAPTAAASTPGGPCSAPRLPRAIVGGRLRRRVTTPTRPAGSRSADVPELVFRSHRRALREFDARARERRAALNR